MNDMGLLVRRDTRKVDTGGPGIYRGRWLAINLDNGVSIALWTFLPPHTDSSAYPTWVTGAALGANPVLQGGNVGHRFG